MVEFGHFWGEEKVSFLDEKGKLQHFPATWTDMIEPDPFVVTAKGRSPLHIDALLQLTQLIEQLQEGDSDDDSTV